MKSFKKISGLEDTAHWDRSAVAEQRPIPDVLPSPWQRGDGAPAASPACRSWAELGQRPTTHRP